MEEKINLRKTDDSSIYNSLTNKQIRIKLKKKLSRENFDSYLKKNKKSLVIKVPDLAQNLVKLEKILPTKQVYCYFAK